MSKPKDDAKDTQVATVPEKALGMVRDASKTLHQQEAEASISAVVQGGATVQLWSGQTFGVVGINEAVAVVTDLAKDAASGDLDKAKGMLMAQATALDVIFNELARRAGLCLGSTTANLHAVDAHLRIALKAQGQCRATLQTLGELVNPRSVAFIKQANMANGPQQVNNGQAAPASQNQIPANELKGLTDERMDAGAQGETGGADTWVATVDAINRAKVPRGQGDSIPKQPKARRAVREVH